MRYSYKHQKDAAFAAEKMGVKFETADGQRLEFYTYNNSFRYAHPTLDHWVYSEGPFYVCKECECLFPEVA